MKKIEQSLIFSQGINSSSARTVIPINFSFPALALPSDLSIISTKYTLMNLKAKASINSITAVQMPDIPLTASQSEALIASLNLEWNSPRMQLDLLIPDSNSNWESVGAVSLLNMSPYPYRQYDLIALATDKGQLSLTNSSQLGVQITDVGYGWLGTNDSISIWGEVLQEIYLDKIEQSPVINVSVPTPQITLTVEGSVIGNNNASYGSIGNCPGVTPSVPNSGQYFTFSSPVTNQGFTISVASGVNITNASDAIIAHLWSQLPTNSFVGKIDPPFASMGNSGGNITVTSTSANQWLTLAIRDPSRSNSYRLPFFTVNNNQITIVG